MIVALMVAPVCPLIHVAVDVDRLRPPVSHRHVDADNLFAIHAHYLYVTVGKDIRIRLVAIDRVSIVFSFIKASSIVSRKFTNFSQPTCQSQMCHRIVTPV